MSSHRFARWSVVLVSMLIGAGCGGNDADESQTAGDAAEQATDDAADTDSDADELVEATDEAASDEDSAAGFGELMEGTFILTGAEEERYFVSDDELGFRLGGGCADGQFGFSVAISDPTGETVHAQFTAELPEDLAGDRTGEFDEVEASVVVLPGGDVTGLSSYEGPVRLVVSEHDSGGVTSDLNARRMTITMLGTMTGDKGDVDVDVTFRWVMGCP